MLLIKPLAQLVALLVGVVIALGIGGAVSSSEIGSVSEVRSSSAKPLKVNEPQKQKMANLFSERRLRALGIRATPLRAQTIAWILAGQRGWRGGEWQCLRRLWHKESGWSWWKWNNSGSGAYGIPQALPARKMLSEGKDWFHNAYTQIVWGLKYIKARYFTPCRALNHLETHNWY